MPMLTHNNMKNETTENNAVALAIAMTPETIQASRDINGTLTETAKVRPVFMTHYANAEQDIYGIADLIESVLRERAAVFPRGIETSELRPVAVAAAMTRQDIQAAIEARFTEATPRYPEQTLKNYLSQFCKGRFAKIQLTSAEDCNRNSAKQRAWRKAHGKAEICRAPRCKWYVIDKD